MIPSKTSASPPLVLGKEKAPSSQAAAPTAPNRDELFRGMHCLDLSSNERIATIMELVAALSRAEEPREVLRIFSQGMAKLNGPRGYVSLSTRGLRPGEYRITRMFSNEGEETLDSTDPWSTRNDLPVYRGGLLGEIIRKAYPEVIHHLHVEDDPVVGNKLAEYRSMMAVPIFDQGEPLNWAVFLLPDPDPFTAAGLEETILRANLVGGTVRKVLMMQELRAANKRIEHEVAQIARIQKTLLPEKMPTITGLSIAASYETFAQAGGDYYDFIPLRYLPGSSTPDPDGPWGIIIADASGHGPAAAVVMAMLHSILHAYPKIPDGPGEVLAHVNQHLSAKRIESSFVTAFFAVYDPPTRRLTYARAGHNPPLIKRAGAAELLRLDHVGGIPLGILPDTEYDDHELTLEPDQTLVLYTDGITEAACPDGQMFGERGLERALAECTGEPECVVGSITASLTEHEDCIEPTDDQTLVAIRIGRSGEAGTG